MTSSPIRRILLSERDIKRLIAHREPFLLIRNAIENEIGKRVTATARQPLSDTTPTQLQLLEGMGQASALLIRQVRCYSPMAIDMNARFLRNGLTPLTY